MPSVVGAKLYIAAVFAAALALRLSMGDAPLSESNQETFSWVLNGLISGLGTILGPEIIDGIQSVVTKLSGRPTERTDSPIIISRN